MWIFRIHSRRESAVDYWENKTNTACMEKNQSLYRIIVVDEEQRTSVKKIDCQLVVLVATCSLEEWRAPLELLEPTLNV